ncbi:hypothetical protein T03_3263 [Trichinella britovi]|uniref:Uncharacterized protein n=1 Tax=Trichinella britovi TaxID=45882 RepID=A0A0V1AB95_TRIBR|nr:hypothetical protein T03_3263 [Trichinella britovi]
MGAFQAQRLCPCTMARKTDADIQGFNEICSSLKVSQMVD